ncbi:hypothetical protein L9F63_021181, partial [Diploptera punctata]
DSFMVFLITFDLGIFFFLCCLRRKWTCLISDGKYPFVYVLKYYRSLSIHYEYALTLVSMNTVLEVIFFSIVFILLTIDVSWYVDRCER